MARIDELKSTLKDVEIHSAIVTSLKKTLWQLGYTYDKPSAWDVLLDEWVDMGNSRKSLHGIAVGDTLVLTTANVGDLVRVTDWAGK